MSDAISHNTTPATASSSAHTAGAAPASPSAPATIQWCLISHTNIGKTTLARTMLGQDVGDIRDDAHVTNSADEYVLVHTPAGNRLTLWDTPGFGDSVKLQQRLAQHGNPLGWFLSHVWDRWRDKPFWLSQQAMLAVRDHADVVLYLVNAAENPQDIGYLDAEIRILAWLRKPVIVLLNQIGAQRSAAQQQQDLQQWQTQMRQYPDLVHQVLVLDAFNRSWLHELALFRAVDPLITPDKTAAWQDVRQQWLARNLARVHASMHAIAEVLTIAAGQRQTFDDAAGNTLWQNARKWLGTGEEATPVNAQQQAMEAMLQSLQPHTAELAEELIRQHQLDGKAAETMRQVLQEHFEVQRPLDFKQAGLLGAVASGAATGVGADLAAGGLTFGAGALIGAIAGAVTFAGAALGMNKAKDRSENSITLTDAFLDNLLRSSLQQYLAISHYGRGRGAYSDIQTPAHWHDALEQAIDQNRSALHAVWQKIRQNSQQRPTGTADQAQPPAAPAELEPLLLTILTHALNTMYAALKLPTDALVAETKNPSS